MKRFCASTNLSATILSSNKHACNSYSGDYGEDYADTVDQLSDEIGLGKLHATGQLKCQPDCPFLEQSEDYSEFDILIGHHSILYLKEARDGRTVYIDGITGDEFVTDISDPDELLTPYLKNNTEFKNYTHFIRNRNDTSLRPSLHYNFLHEDFTVNNGDRTRAIEGEGHHLARLAFFGLLYSVELDNGWETTYHYDIDRHLDCSIAKNRYEVLPTGPDRWSVASLDYSRHRVVREPGESISDDEIHIFRAPDFSSTNGVIGFDIDPKNEVWNTCYGIDFNHERILEDEETTNFLRQTMDISVIQVANSLKPYDGNNVTEGRDTSVTLWSGIDFDDKPIVVSTKNALQNYEDKQPALLYQDSIDNYRYRDGRSIDSPKSRVVVAHGAPRPSNDEIQILGALMGESIPDDTNSNQSFGNVGDKVRHQFMHSRVARKATSFDEDGKGTVIVLNTTACPDWLCSNKAAEVDVMDMLPANAPARRDIARYLRDEYDDPVTRKEIRERADVSENSVRKALERFGDHGWVVEHEVEEGKTQYKYEWC